MKKTLYGIIILLSTTNLFAQCPTTDVVLQSQAEVNAFATSYPTCSNLTVNLSIGKSDFTASDINDLNPLSNLASIGGFLYIHDNPNLINFNGLGNISTVTTGIYIDNNSGITDFTGLSGIVNIGYVDVRNNSNLTTISALSSITNMTGYLSIYNNANLLNLTGLDNVTSINDVVYIGFNGNLTSLLGLNAVTSITGYLQVDTNASLTNFSGLNQLATIGDYLYVNNNALLQNFVGLSSLTTIGDYLNILNNIALVDFTGLNALTSTGTSFNVTSNNAILNLNGFDSLTSVGTFVRVKDNAAITSLDGLEALTTITTNLEIDGGMPNLTSISGISNIDYTSISSLFIRNNTSLSLCEELNICNYLNNGGAASISGNAVGCSSVAEVNTACIPVLGILENTLDSKLSIFPNPTKDIINIKVANGIELKKVSIYSLQGKLINNYEMSDNKINIEKLSSGIYLMKVVTNEDIMSVKIVKL